MSIGETPYTVTISGSPKPLASTRGDHVQVTVQAYSTNGGMVFLKFVESGSPGTVDINNCNYELPAVGSVPQALNTNESIGGQTIDLTRWFVDGTDGDKVRVSAQYRYDP